VFLHYALLVAYISRVGEIVGDAVDLDRSICSIAFAAGLGGFVYAAPDKVLEKANNALVFAVIGTFLPLLYIAGESVDPANLIEVHDWVVRFLYLVCSRVRNWTDVVFCLTS
jgi:tyrosine-specific transport protein